MTMKLRHIQTSDPILNRIQDSVFAALARVSADLVNWKLDEGPWPKPSSPVCLLIQHFEGGSWVTRAYLTPDGVLHVA